MRDFLKGAAFAVLSASSLIAVPADAQGARLNVAMQNFKFVPSILHLRAGLETTLHFTNQSSGRHSFTAPAFFAAAKLGGPASSVVRNGSVELAGGQSVDVTVIAAPGRYPVKCDHAFHKMLGMSGTILVD